MDPMIPSRCERTEIMDLVKLGKIGKQKNLVSRLTLRGPTSSSCLKNSPGGLYGAGTQGFRRTLLAAKNESGTHKGGTPETSTLKGKHFTGEVSRVDNFNIDRKFRVESTESGYTSENTKTVWLILKW